MQFAMFCGLLTLAFARPLWELLRFSLDQELHSHVVLIPFVSGYLIWLRRHASRPACVGSPTLAVIPLAIGVGLLKSWFSLRVGLAAADQLALSTSSYLCLLWAGALALLGWRFVCQYLFQFLFLIFIIPLPTAVENALEIFFQHTSADAAAGIFGLSGTTYFRDGLVFQLPGISIRVAQECSGIRSSVVLFITSLIAGHMFLKSMSFRTMLTLFVIPLGIIRNGFRIWTISMLCIHVDPGMIDSPIHHRGGPVFFALSLIPFFLFLFWLRRLERKRDRTVVAGMP